MTESRNYLAEAWATEPRVVELEQAIAHLKKTAPTWTPPAPPEDPARRLVEAAIVGDDLSDLLANIHAPHPDPVIDVHVVTSRNGNPSVTVTRSSDGAATAVTRAQEMLRDRLTQARLDRPDKALAFLDTELGNLLRPLRGKLATLREIGNADRAMLAGGEKLELWSNYRRAVAEYTALRDAQASITLPVLRDRGIIETDRVLADFGVVDGSPATWPAEGLEGEAARAKPVNAWPFAYDEQLLYGLGRGPQLRVPTIEQLFADRDARSELRTAQLHAHGGTTVAGMTFEAQQRAMAQYRKQLAIALDQQHYDARRLQSPLEPAEAMFGPQTSAQPALPERARNAARKRTTARAR